MVQPNIRHSIVIALLTCSHVSARIMNLTDSWQLVGEDDDIPRGAHVQLDMSTGNKYAKLLDPNDNSGSENETMSVLFENPDEIPAAVPETHAENRIIPVDEPPTNDNGIVEKPYVPRKHSKRDSEEETGLFHALDKLQKTKTLDADMLERIEELAHDIEYGPVIMERSAQTLAEVVGDAKVSREVRDYAARIIGASLRNNPYAHDVVFAHYDSLVASLVTSLTRERDSELQNRILYAIGAALTDSRGKREFVQGSGLTPLRALFEKSSSTALVRNRVLVTLSDLLDAEKGGECDISDLHAELQIWAHLCARGLMESHSWAGGPQDTYAYNMLHLLTQIKTAFTTTSSGANGSISVSDEFVKWLAHQAVQEARTRDSEYADLVKEVRHKVFGNAFAARNHDDL